MPVEQLREWEAGVPLSPGMAGPLPTDAIPLPTPLTGYNKNEPQN